MDCCLLSRGGSDRFFCPWTVAQASIDRKKVRIAALEGKETTEITVEVPPGHGGEGSGLRCGFLQVVTGPGAYMVVKIPDGLSPGQTFTVDTIVQTVPAADLAPPDASAPPAHPVSPPPAGPPPPPPYAEHAQHESVGPPVVPEPPAEEATEEAPAAAESAAAAPEAAAPN